MNIKEKLPVSYLLFTTNGRIDRKTYIVASIFIWTSFYILSYYLETLVSVKSTFGLYPILAWVIYATSKKRLHDSGLSAWWLTVILVPILGQLLLLFLLFFRKGTKNTNQYGLVPGTASDYFKNPEPAKVNGLNPDERIVNDVTQLNPIKVAKVVSPLSVEEIQELVKTSSLPISVGGGRFSMGGQTSSFQSLHIDMKNLNEVIDFDREKKIINVQSGIRWCDIQHYIDKYDLSVKIMQTYANFTVGGSLSVNCHGRYIGLGPLILSVKSIGIVLADGTHHFASPTINSELFYGSIGCYNAIGIIVSAELELTENNLVKRSHTKMELKKYKDFFESHIENNEETVFHNADIYPPKFKNVRAVSWTKTRGKPTTKDKLMPLSSAYPIERYFIGAFSRSNFGKWRREYLIDPIYFSLKRIHWRNYEAGYDVFELEPHSRKKSTYVLQEYFVEQDKLEDFVSLMSAIFTKYKVNVINVSIRHSKKDPGSLLAWSRYEKVFAFVVWYKQSTTKESVEEVGRWTRELIDAVISLGGAYYLPYQQHATSEQFHKAYPKAAELFQLKKRLDPDYKFRNIIWDKYYANRSEI